MSEPGAVKQKDLFPRNGIKPADARKIRDRLLTEDDWYKEGVTIWIRPSGIQRLAIAEEEPKLAQRFVELQGIRPAPSKRYVLCRLLGESCKVACLVPMKYTAETFCGPVEMVNGMERRGRGKIFEAEELTNQDGTKQYRHKECAKFRRT